MTHWAYLYLLRVPLLAWLVLVGLAPLSVWGAAPLGPVLRGLFDLAPAAGGGGNAGLVPAPARELTWSATACTSSKGVSPV